MPAIAERYRKGKTLPEIAKEDGVSYQAIYRFLLTEAREEYRSMVEELHSRRVAEADMEIRQAGASKDPVRATCAVALAKFARMDFERRCPDKYGVKQEVKHTGGGPMLNIVLLDRPSSERDVTPVAALEQKAVG